MYCICIIMVCYDVRCYPQHKRDHAPPRALLCKYVWVLHPLRPPMVKQCSINNLRQGNSPFTLIINHSYAHLSALPAEATDDDYAATAVHPCGQHLLLLRSSLYFFLYHLPRSHTAYHHPLTHSRFLYF